jgi:probable HAF family extracellular repeat protein
MTNLGTLPGQAAGSIARGINASGQIVGTAGNYAFLYQNGVMTNLGSLGLSSDAYGINKAGQVVGQSNLNSSTAHAFLYANGSMIDLGALKPGEQSVAFAINNGGYIVGECGPDAFLYANGSMKDLNNLIPAGTGWTLNNASGINDIGQITGWGTIKGETHAFLLDPVSTVPEPSSVVLCGIAVVALLGYRWRKSWAVLKSSSSPTAAALHAVKRL